MAPIKDIATEPGKTYRATSAPLRPASLQMKRCQQPQTRLAPPYQSRRMTERCVRLQTSCFLTVGSLLRRERQNGQGNWVTRSIVTNVYHRHN
jgi:hypothetical protein